MKKIIISLFVLFLFQFSFVFAQDGDTRDSGALDNHESLTLEEILQNIRTYQGVNKNIELNCDSITSNQFEEIGEAWMVISHPLEEHDLIHEMTKIDNPESFDLLHLKNGLDYLGCGLSFDNIGNDEKHSESGIDDVGHYASIVILSGLIIFLIALLYFRFFRKKKND